MRRLVVMPAAGGSREPFFMVRSHAIIGRAEGCDIRLPDPAVGYRHAYLQVLWGQIACVDLGSETGTLWDGERRACDWLTLGRKVLIGAHTIELVDDGRGNVPDAEFPIDCNPLAPDPVQFGPLQKVELQLLNATKDKAIRITRPITRVGQHPDCELRLQHKSVSGVHCSLVLTKRKFWIVDLLGKGGTLLNGVPLKEQGEPMNGDELGIGGFRLKVQMPASA
jgi:pSer/pThr/pTyr-binding forkhead associated (FHA) protein